MFRKRQAIPAVLLATAVLAASACGTADGNTPTTLVLGHAWSATDANAVAVQDFADEIAEASDGSLRVEVYPSGQLGDDAEALEGLGLGTVDMWVGGSGVYSQMTPVGQFLVLPYLFDDIDEAMDVYTGDLGERVADRITADTGTRVVSWWPRGARHLTLNERATTPADIAGLRIRVPENPMILRTWAELGASPTPMAFGDVLTALEQGALEGQENPLTTIDSAGLSVAQSTLILTGHVIEPTAVSIGDDAWDRLTGEQRDILTTAASGAVRTGLLDYVRSQEKLLVDKLAEDGMTVVEPDRQAFRERTASLAAEAGPVVEDLYRRVVSR
ncbi:TRAP transporter substrate-binding protein [Actinophytocola gossypii]|uniref:TRAP transporter substrate-binding protein n=1 Tax=Actinophytocola gossypii TaxID=2812003 RepID=A0ABT2J1W8_9PSEU|nr:TRAP transporter substrate-binding protein [Actinophytocola gossypii]MCT2581850.1 TRAP transporter substrate-binding protein [Actinophytocola gossypii]